MEHSVVCDFSCGFSNCTRRKLRHFVKGHMCSISRHCIIYSSSILPPRARNIQSEQIYHGRILLSMDSRPWWVTDIRLEPFCAANSTLAAFDTCVFIAITWRLSNSLYSIKSDDPVLKKKFDLLGRYLPAFSRALLQDGQKYYMVAMLANLLVLILQFAPRIPMAYRAIFLTPAVGLTNIMACRVFRHTKMKHKDEDVHAVSTIMFQKSGDTPVFIHTQIGGLTTSSATGSELRCLSATDTAAPSSNSSDKLAHLSKEAISEV